MSPDIEWRVKDSSSEQALAKTPSTPATRWRASLVVLMIALGAGLGLVYTSIKEPAPQLTPTALPTVIPTTVLPSVFETIDREALALADGDLKVFLSVQDQTDPRWFQAQSRNFQAWGRPSLKTAPLYSIVGVQPDSLPPDRTALDTLQYRNGEYFRQTRFYRRQDDHWVRTAPDLSFWSGQYQTSTTQHFTVTYPIEDSVLISIAVNRFESIYDQVCADLHCLGDLSIRLTFDPKTDLMLPPRAVDTISPIFLPSLRTLGFYNTVDWVTLDELNEPLIQRAVNELVPLLVQAQKDDPTRRVQNGQGEFYVQAIKTWEFYRVLAQPSFRQLLPPAQLSNNIPLINLESLWTMQNVPSNPEQVANSVILFIEQKYGVDSVGNFLKAIDPADSWAQTIKTSLGMDAIQFEQQWKAWLKEVYAQGS